MRMRLWALVVAIATLSACAVNQPPPIPQPPPTVRQLQGNVTIVNEAGQNVEDAVGTLVTDGDPAAGRPEVTATSSGWRETFNFQSPPVCPKCGGTLTVKSKDYITQSVRVLIPDGAGELPNVVMHSVDVIGTESGPLHTVGMQIIGDNGQPWRGLGYTNFQLARKNCAGEDIEPLIEDVTSIGGYNYFRVLGMFDPYIGTFRLAVTDPAAFDRCVLALARNLGNHLLRMEFTVFADAQNIMPSVSDQQRWFAHIVNLLGNEWNLMIELCNECSKNGVDPSQFNRPLGFKAIFARGSNVGGEDPAHPAWDYATWHEDRGDEYPRHDEARPYMLDPNSPLKGFPVWQDEPIGASEVASGGRRDGAKNGDNGDQAVREFGQMGANFALHGPWALFHSDAGIIGGILGPIQRRMATSFATGMLFVPPQAQMSPYQRGDNCGNCDGVGGMPLEQLDAYELRVFCKQVNGMEYCADIRHSRAPIPRNGWHIAEQPIDGVIRLER